MRISTSMMFQQGINQIQTNYTNLMETSLQASSGKKVNKPSDDPIAASKIIQLQQGQDTNKNHIDNIGNASSLLKSLDGNLNSVGSLLQDVRQVVLQANNSTITMAERQTFAAEIRGRFHDLLGLANADDGQGQSVYSGFQGDIKEPFTGQIDDTGVLYHGDQGQRKLQVSATRLLPVSFSGDDVFMNIPGVNSKFTTSASATNTGKAQIDLGSLSTTTGQLNAKDKYQIQIGGAAGALTYTVMDVTTGNPAVNSAGTPLVGQPFVTGSKITFSSAVPASVTSDNDLSVTISGSPAVGDNFDIQPTTAAAPKNDMFSILKDLVDVLEDKNTPAKYPPSSNSYGNALSQIVGKLDAASDNVMRVRAQEGAYINEATALQDVATQRDLQYSQNISDLQDVDYTKTISQINQQQTFLQAAQQTYMKTTGMTLFNYLS